MSGLPGSVPGAAVTIALLLVGVGLAGAAYRLVRGPEPADRVVALDLITVLLIAITSLIALRTENVLYLDPALALGLVGFLATVALARYLERRTPRDRENAATADVAPDARTDARTDVRTDTGADANPGTRANGPPEEETPS